MRPSHQGQEVKGRMCQEVKGRACQEVKGRACQEVKGQMRAHAKETSELKDTGGYMIKKRDAKETSELKDTGGGGEHDKKGRR